MHAHLRIGLLCGLTLMSLSGCLASPEPKPAPCGLVEQELTEYSKRYFHALAEIGVLRQQLKESQQKQ